MEHPTFIPMYTLTTLQTPRGLMMRPQLYAIGHKVNSLLSEPSVPTCETWLLPHIYVLCMTRNKEEDHGQDGEDTKYKDQEKKLPEATAVGRPTRTGLPTTPRLRTTDQDRTSDDHQPPDDRQRPEIRQIHTRAKSPDVRQVPDDRTLASHRTSGTRRTTGACALPCVGPQPMYPFTYPFVALDYIYSSTSS